MPDGESSGSAPVHVRDLPPHEIPRRCGLGGADDSPDYPREPAYLVLLALDRPDRALGLVKGLGITGGRLGDVYGRRRMFLLGVGGFTAASLLCGLAWSSEFLIAARVAQGAMAALMMPQILSTIQAAFPAEERPKAYGCTAPSSASPR